MDIIAKVVYAFYAAANLDKALAHQGDERGYRA
jgi:hypothetical protein